MAFYKKRPSEWTRKEVIQFSVPLVVAILAIIIPLVVTRGGGRGSNSSSTSSSPVNVPRGTYYARLGHALTLKGAHGSVTIQLTRIVDPAIGNNAFLRSGNRYVATEFRVSNPTAQLVNGLIAFNSFTTVVGSDGQTYSADQVDTVSECTSFYNGPNQIVSGQSVTGCVVFQIPGKVSPGKVQVTVGNERGIWTNP
jgi:hypothetical protein